MAAAEPIHHDELTELAIRLRLGAGASEIHGSLCGYLAGGGVVGRQSLLALLQLDGEPVAPSGSDQLLLEQLTSQAEQALADHDLGFEPMLPPDDRALAERAEALVEWCRGFLGGFGLAGAEAHGQLTDEAQEVLRDLGTIAASDFDFGDAGEDEDALIELQEFVRVGAMLLFAECAAPRRSTSGSLH